MTARWILLPIAVAAAIGAEARGQRQMERLDRGTVALRTADGAVLVGWRLLGDDPVGVVFVVERSTDGGPYVAIGEVSATGGTNLVDREAGEGGSLAYVVRPVVGGEIGPPSGPVTVQEAPYRSIPLRKPERCTPNDASVGDLDGDGDYEIVLKQEMRPRDNSQAGFTGSSKLEAYDLDRGFLWRIDLGPNVREGAHYTPFLVYDLDGDGRAEVACRTADGTVDGAGTTIGDPGADHRNDRGYVLEGPEFLTVFDGRTGAALATTDYLPPRGVVADWGDDYGNRVDRFNACVAYLDGERPSLVMARGYYTRTVLVAWDWHDGALSRRWTFDSDDGTAGNRSYRGQGNHGIAVADVDGDGRDEIIYGASCIDDDGTGLHSTGLGHGDALHLSDLDPSRSGLEVFGIHEHSRQNIAATFRDAATGAVLWSLPGTDAGRGLAMDVDPRFPGAECWASGHGLGGLYSCKGERIGPRRPRSCNMGVWWDGDPLRELLDGTTIAKWDPESATASPLLRAEAFECASNNGTKANPCLCADLFGDWREEVLWRTRDNAELRIFSTTVPTAIRLPTLMHDPTYRLAVAWQNVGYNQPAQPGYFLGAGMEEPPRPSIRLVGGGD